MSNNICFALSIRRIGSLRLIQRPSQFTRQFPVQVIPPAALQLGLPQELRLALLDDRVSRLKLWNPLQLLLSNLLQVHLIGALRIQSWISPRPQARDRDAM
jgi:hypothetical protein